MNWRVTIPCLLAILLHAHTPLFALDPAKSITQFSLQRWAREDGLPANKITSITQTNDGYLWLGTAAGLVRFDGLSFKHIPGTFAGARGKEIRKLVAARSGGLHLIINHGGAASFDGQHFTPLGNDRWPADATGKTIFEAREGAVWTGYNFGFGRWVAGHDQASVFERRPERVFAICEDPHGRVWLGTENRGLFYSDNGVVSEAPDLSMREQIVNALVVGPDQLLWVGTPWGLRCYDLAGNRLPSPEFSAAVNALLFDRQGVLWIATAENGLARFQNGQFTFLHQADGLASNKVLAVFEDAEGSLWVGTQEGLTQLADVKFPILNKEQGLASSSTNSIAISRRGGVWQASSRGLFFFDGRQGRQIDTSEMSSDAYILLTHEGRDGDLYVSHAKKMFSVLRDGRLVSRTEAPDWLMALAEDAEGAIAATGPALFRFRDGRLVPFDYHGATPPRYSRIEHLLVARDGTLWVASHEGLFAVRGAAIRHWDSRSEFANGRVNFLCEDADGTLWAGLTTGLARCRNGTIAMITPEQGLPGERIYAVVADDLGNLWLDSADGYVRVSRQALNDLADRKVPTIRWEVFNHLDAVKSIDRGSDQINSGGKTPDGRVWFPNALGVVVINPAALPSNPVLPPVHIERIRVEGREISPRTATTATALRVGDERVEFTFAALSYISPQRLHVRYRLEGHDPDWIEAETHRTALYRLKSGRYRFVVQAANVDGVWNTTAPGFSFVIPPAFHETIWFYCLGGAALLFLLAGLYRWKVRHLRRRHARLLAANDLLEARVAERTAELAYERDLLRTLLDSSPDYIYFKDAQSRFIKCSQAQARALGVASVDQVVGKTDADFFPADHARPALEVEQTILRTGTPVLGSIEQVTCADGKTHWFLASKMPLRNKANEIVGTFGLSKDITVLKEAEAKLIEVHQQLLETSRRAGMADVATSVLHNVGNVLNSVNVSVSLLGDHLHRSKMPFVQKTAALLAAHIPDAGTFLTTDQKGKMIPSYLLNLGTELLDEHTTFTTEVDQLRKNIEHIKEIVAMQQNYAKVLGVAEAVPLAEVVNDAISINAAGLSRHRVQLERDYQVQPTLTTERHRVIQILVNLIRNAKYACDEGGAADKKVVIRLTQHEQRVRVSVIDNGVGIPAENLTRIFSHGFTTRKGGHGFGLHSSALVARELGGSLVAQSDGPGLGASFILELPLDAAPPADPAAPGAA